MNEEANQKIMSMQRWFAEQKVEGVKDVIIAYSSLTIFYDPWLVAKANHVHSSFEFINSKLQRSYYDSLVDNRETGSLFRIPVCYDLAFGFDLEAVSAYTKLPVEKIISIHQSKTYRVYMLGFLPGFAYLGELDAALYMPRKDNPVAVSAGSVGITSNQTGIYPLNSPGGWQIIGRTPTKLFDPSQAAPVEMQAGDRVEFYAISKEEFDTERQLVKSG